MQNEQIANPIPSGILPDEYQLWEFYFLFQGVRNSYPPPLKSIALRLGWTESQVQQAHQGLEAKGCIYSEKIAGEHGRNIVALKMRIMDLHLFGYWDRLSVN